jgi:hypothetical protein
VVPPAAPAKPIDPEKPALRQTPPKDAWRSGLTDLRRAADRLAGEPGASAEWGIRSRVLGWLAGDTEGRPEGATWSTVLTALTSATGPETPEPATLSRQVRDAVDALEGLAPLEVTELTLCRRVFGFMLHEPVDANALKAGQPVLLYCEMRGLRYEPLGEQVRSRLGSRVEIVRAGGGEPVWTETLATAEDICPRRRRDYYVNYRVLLPANLPPGSYTLRLTQTDLLADRSATSSAPLVVVP